MSRRAIDNKPNGVGADRDELGSAADRTGRSGRRPKLFAPLAEVRILGDMKLFEPIAMCPLVTLRDHEKRGPSLLWLRRQVARPQPDWPTRAPR